MTDPAAAFRAARDLLLDLRTDHTAANAAFTWPAPGSFNWATDWFDALAREQPYRTALIVAEPDGTARTRTFGELARGSDARAGWLQEIGVGKGDVVMTVLDNRPELWELMLAAMKTGAVLAPCGTDLPAPSVADRARRARVRLLVAAAPDAARLAEVPAADRALLDGDRPGWRTLREDPGDAAPRPVPVAAGDPLMIYFTSGTTSRPKMVLHTYGSYPVGHLSSLYFSGLRPGDVHCNLSGPGWAKHSWSNLFVPWTAGATVVAAASPPDPAGLLAILDRHRVTSLCAPPFLWRALAAGPLPGGALRLREATSSGEPLSPSVAAALRDRTGVRVRDGYGQTEATAMIGNAPGDDHPPGALGRPLPGYRIVLRDPDTGALGDAGEICVDVSAGAPGLTAGYLDDAGAARPVVHDGLYRTGDLARRDADGVLYFVGRRDDLFRSRGHLVSPVEIEHALVAHPAVREAAVVPATVGGVPVPRAVLVLRPGARDSADLRAAIRAHADARLAAHARPGPIEVGEIPRTATGKISRRSLR
ncbi:acyl-CoA synthetase [Actinomadura atramentaria]|uniref:acyl-CoA synthetase n=1 Tax=Actinomadura atramentaria TaxID=1990 RepID=UPI0003823245|nr:AMP-binding protein [Actinomadura atramentaria]